MTFQNGDKVFVVCDYRIKHYGIIAIWFGHATVVHNAKGRGVIETDVSSFSAGRTIYIETENRAATLSESEAMVERARSY